MLVRATSERKRTLQAAAARALQPGEVFVEEFEKHARKTYARIRMQIRTGEGRPAAIERAVQDLTAFLFVFATTRGRMCYPDVVQALLTASSDEVDCVRAEAVAGLRQLRAVRTSLLGSGYGQPLSDDIKASEEELLASIDAGLVQGLTLLGA